LTWEKELRQEVASDQVSDEVVLEAIKAMSEEEL